MFYFVFSNQEVNIDIYAVPVECIMYMVRREPALMDNIYKIEFRQIGPKRYVATLWHKNEPYHGYFRFVIRTWLTRLIAKGGQFINGEEKCHLVLHANLFDVE